MQKKMQSGKFIKAIFIYPCKNASPMYDNYLRFNFDFPDHSDISMSLEKKNKTTEPINFLDLYLTGFEFWHIVCWYCV